MNQNEENPNPNNNTSAVQAPKRPSQFENPAVELAWAQPGSSGDHETNDSNIQTQNTPYPNHRTSAVNAETSAVSPSDDATRGPTLREVTRAEVRPEERVLRIAMNALSRWVKTSGLYEIL